MNKKYIIRRTTLRYENGSSDILECHIETNDINEERERLKREHKCKYVHFRFMATDERYIKTGEIFKLIDQKKGNVTEDDLCDFLDNPKK